MRISDWSSDVCSSDLISEATEELREQIKRMRRANLTPEQFGLYVQSHPDSLMVTAANKMRMGQKITVSQNLTGKLMGSWKVPTSRGPNEDNEKLISKFWSDGFGKSVTPTTKGWVVHVVDPEIIQAFTRSQEPREGKEWGSPVETR